MLPGGVFDSEYPYEHSRAFLTRALMEERTHARPAFITVPAPYAPLETFLGAAPRDMSTLWHPPRGDAWSCAGAVFQRQLDGSNSLETVAAMERDILRRLATVASPGIAPLAPKPRMFGGIAFAPGGNHAEPWGEFGDGCFVLPRWSYTRRGDLGFLSVALSGEEGARGVFGYDAILEEGYAILDALEVHEGGRTASIHFRAISGPSLDRVEQLPASEWRQLIEGIRAGIRSGAFEKVVAARRCRVSLPRPVDDLVVLARLGVEFTETTRFAFRRQSTSLVGVSPETLFEKTGSTIRTEALAGTVPSLGSEFPNASAQSRRLLASNKDRSEHDHVVQAIAAALHPLCLTLDYNAHPTVRKVRSIIHLNTPFEGILKPDISVAELLAALHPTPAVGGMPRGPAVDFIRTHEQAARGWYTGAVGWVDSVGDAAFNVVIRSGVLAERQAWIYTGAGIVADSDPDSEYAETALKQQPILRAVGVVS